MPPERLPVATAARVPDADQDDVILSSPDAKLIVESGPGCGKTDVACARVAHLIEQGIPGARIVLLSFTRTAVREIRTRIKQLAARGIDVAEADVRTIDSFAWRLRTGVREVSGVRLGGSYEDSIRQATSLMEGRDSAVLEYLQSLHHVLVDESQDLVGDRAAFVRALLRNLPQRCGWTVFLDPAQAIFDWSEASQTAVGQTTAFVESVRELERTHGARTIRLRKLYRASDGDLCRFMESTRSIVLSGESDVTRTIRELAFKHVDADETPLDEIAFAQLVRRADSCTLFLFRTRVEVLEASRWLSNQNVRHRLRLGGLPYAVAPWIGATVGPTGARDISEAEFAERWGIVAASNEYLVSGWQLEDAWRTLRKLGWDRASKRVLVTKVAERLGQATLPDELSVKEIGLGGPIIGTIHGSKGREAPSVFACLLTDRDGAGVARDTPDEARVIYVALTRAREHCAVRCSTGLPFKTNRSGRVWRHVGYEMRLECGREGDVDRLGALLASGVPHSQQQSLASWKGDSVPLFAIKTPDEGLERRKWRHVIVRGSGHRDAEPVDKALASFSKAWTEDVHENIFRKARWRMTPNKIYDLRLIDLTTVAAPADDPLLAYAPEPWRTSRLWLSPVVLSWAKAYMPKKKAQG